jgi:hypothetical protein
MRVDLGKQIEGSSTCRPSRASLGSLDESVYRDNQRSDDLPHIRSVKTIPLRDLSLSAGAHVSVTRASRLAAAPLTGKPMAPNPVTFWAVRTIDMDTMDRATAGHHARPEQE